MMIKVYAGGVDTEVVEDLAVVHEMNYKKYEWVHFKTGRSWFIPTKYKYLAQYVDDQYEDVEPDELISCDEHWDADGRMYYVYKAIIDTDGDGDIELYLTVPE